MRSNGIAEKYLIVYDMEEASVKEVLLMIFSLKEENNEGIRYYKRRLL